MKIPKYITEVINNGRLRIFEGEQTFDCQGFEKYTFQLFPKDSLMLGSQAIEDKETTVLADKIISFANRNGALTQIGKWDWVNFQPRQRDMKTEKVYFLQLGITDPVAFELEKLISPSHVLDSRGYEKNMRLFDCYDDGNTKVSQGWFIKKSILNYTAKTEKEFDDGNLVLYSRNDHDRYSWHTKWFDAHKEIVSNETLNHIGNEATKITFDLHKKFINGVSDIRECLADEAERLSDTEGNLYYDGLYADYWIRIIARQGDYNMYVKAYKKGV